MPRRSGSGGITTPSQGRQPAGGGKPPVAPPFGITDPRLVPDDPIRRPKQRRPKEILRRQRVLKNLGYKIVVDGIWGPRSQRAWKDYLRRQQSGDLRNSPFRKEGAAGRTSLVRDRGERGASEVVTPEDARRERARRAEVARRERVEEQAAQRAAILDRAARLRNDPRAAASFSLRELAEVVLDKETKLGVQTRQGATIMQTWLRSRGYKVSATGVYDRQTHDALEVAQRRAVKAETRLRAKRIADELYTKAGVKPGDKPAWFPLAGGVPTPEKLDALLQGGGFTARLVLDALIRASMTEANVFNQWRETELRKLAAKHNPIIDAAMKTGLEPNLLWVYSSILGATDLVPFPDLSDLAKDGDITFEDAIEFRAKNEEQIQRNAQRVSALRGEAKALLTAKDADDFNAKLLAQLEAEEKSYMEFAKSRAAEQAGFFGKVVEGIVYPGEKLRVFTLYAAEKPHELFTQATGNMTRQTAVPVTLESVQRQYDEMHPVLRFGYEVAVDPLNFVHPLRVSSTFLKMGTRGSTLGSYRLVGSGRLWDRALVYEKGTWSKAGVLDRSAMSVLGGSRLQPAYDAMVDFGRKMTQLREVAVAKAQSRVAVQMRHAFRKPADPVAAKSWKAKQPKKQIRDRVDTAMAAVESWIEEAPELDSFFNAAVTDRASLYVDSARTTYSNVGAAMLANLAEKARVAAVHQIATESTDDIAEELAAKGVAWEARREPLSQEYERIVNDAGVYITGGRGDKAMASEVFGRTVSRMDEIEYVLLPSFQNIIERRLSQEGLTLWDESGLWLGRQGEAAETIRGLGRESFADEATTEIDNPAFGIGHTWDEAVDAIENEIRRRTPRIYSYQARNMKAGTLPDGFDADVEAENIRQEVWAAWEKRGDEYFDTRPKVEVSALYARHNGNAYRVMSSEISAMLRGSTREDDLLDAIAVVPKLAMNGPVDDGLWRVMWTMGSRFKNRPLIDHPTRRSFLPGTMPGYAPSMTDEAQQFRFDQYRRGSLFNERVSEAKLALAEAADQSLPRELVAEGAYMVALSKAQSAYFRAAYKLLYGSMAVWRFLTLPLRPGWVVRNTVDNTVKAIIRGVHDPRYFFLGAAKPGARVRSIFDNDLAVMRQSVEWLGKMFNTPGAVQAFDAIVARIFDLPSKTLNSIFKAHALPEVPEAALDAARLRLNDVGKARSPVRVTKADYQRAGVPVPKKMKDDGELSVAERLGQKIAASPDTIWDMMAARPENYMKRVIYRSTHQKAMQRHLAGGASEVEASLLAHEEAWDEVTNTLFDYGAISVVESNFKVFFPFIDFWRKNTGFWVREFGSKPWLSLAVLKFDQERQEAHADLPRWMQRYIHADEIVDAAAVVPGLDRVVEAMLPEDAMFDPMSMASFAPLYRAYRNLAYGDNALLPGEQAGMAIVGPMLDAMNDWGLSMNPLVRKPLEGLNVASDRAWQSVFPQTPMLEAMSREFLGGIGADWPSAFEKLVTFGGANPESIAENFEFYVQQEIAGQVARGEEPNRAKAEATIRGWFFIQNAYSYFGGIYWRRATPEDIYLSKLADGEYEGLSPEEQRLRQLWALRGMDRLSYDRYLEMLPLIEAYYRLDDPGDKYEMTQEYPELRRYVSSEYRGKPWSGGWMRNMRRYTETAKFFTALKMVEAVDPAPDVRQAALDMFATPELRASWKANDTPQQIRDRQVKGEVSRYYRELNQAYFSIPETDYEARDGFVAEHPELVQWWNRNNDPSDDFEAILGAANADLREQYFAVVESQGWDAAAKLLKRHPFMFEDTKSSGKVNEETGEWRIGTGKGWSAERVKDFREAKPHLTWFFDTFLKSVGEQKAFAWLRDSETDAAKVLRGYFSKYPSNRRIAYLKAAPHLKLYFGMPEKERGEWLDGNSDGARIVRAYFEKYGKRGMTQHAQDYLAAKGDLDYYFSLSKDQRSAWLDSKDERAAKVLAYFKKYGREHAYTRLLEKYPKLAGGTPEQRRRLEFWREFFRLSPDKRPLYVLENAEAHGVFIYGEFGETERHDNEMEWMRRAVGLGLNEKQSAFLYVRPLLAFYRTLDGAEKGMFLRANPELQEYFDKFVTKSVTGDKKLDAEVERYFRLPPDSFARSEFLRRHPQVQDWFDKRSSPAERAMRNLLEQYFSMSAFERTTFLEDHPEIPAYFEQRREEKAAEASIYQAFDRADPRLRPFFEDAEDLIRAAERMREKLRRAAYDAVSGIETRRDRRPAA